MWFILFCLLSGILKVYKAWICGWDSSIAWMIFLTIALYCCVAAVATSKCFVVKEQLIKVFSLSFTAKLRTFFLISLTQNTVSEFFHLHTYCLLWEVFLRQYLIPSGNTADFNKCNSSQMRAEIINQTCLAKINAKFTSSPWKISLSFMPWELRRFDVDSSRLQTPDREII